MCTLDVGLLHRDRGLTPLTSSNPSMMAGREAGRLLTGESLEVLNSQPAGLGRAHTHIRASISRGSAYDEISRNNSEKLFLPAN